MGSRRLTGRRRVFKRAFYQIRVDFCNPTSSRAGGAPQLREALRLHGGSAEHAVECVDCVIGQLDRAREPPRASPPPALVRRDLFPLPSDDVRDGKEVAAPPPGPRAYFFGILEITFHSSCMDRSRLRGMQDVACDPGSSSTSSAKSQLPIFAWSTKAMRRRACTSPAFEVR